MKFKVAEKSILTSLRTEYPVVAGKFGQLPVRGDNDAVI